MMISIEILLLAVTILVLASSMNFDDILGQTYGIYIILLAAAESAIGPVSYTHLTLPTILLV